MALGMADVIQNAAGSVKVDAMFIDEGFGSLDEESRTRAVQVLQELSGGRRLIGIISHVTELKEEMGHKLVVKKGMVEGMAMGKSGSNMTITTWAMNALPNDLINMVPR